MSRFVYVTYIRTSPQKLWDALTTPETMRLYWFGGYAESSWKTGAPWKLYRDNGGVADEGEILESDPPRRLVIKWRNMMREEFAAEGFTRCTMEIEEIGAEVKLTIVHESEVDQSKVIAAVSGGWPKILASLKTLLETGTAMDVA